MFSLATFYLRDLTKKILGHILSQTFDVGSTGHMMHWAHNISFPYGWIVVQGWLWVDSSFSFPFKPEFESLHILRTTYNVEIPYGKFMEQTPTFVADHLMSVLLTSHHFFEEGRRQWQNHYGGTWLFDCPWIPLISIVVSSSIITAHTGRKSNLCIICRLEFSCGCW